MARIPSFKTRYTPRDLFFYGEDGKLTRNIDLPAEEQVRCVVTFADVEQKAQYMSFSTGAQGDDVRMYSKYEYNNALKKHVKKIEGLFLPDGTPIEDGAGLVASGEPGLNDLKLDLFHRICGIRLDDQDQMPGDLLPGEPTASS